MNEAIILTTVLMLGILFGLIGRIALDSMFKHIDKIKAIMKNNAAWKLKREEVEKMHAMGEMHEWVEVETAKGKLLVCNKTGWSPALQGFIPMENLRAHLENVKFEEDYKVFRNERVLELAKQNSYTIEQMEKLVYDIFSIKKDFHVKKLADLQIELKEKARNVDAKTGNKI